MQIHLALQKKRYLDKRKAGPYWTNTSSNSLIGSLIQKGTRQVKETFEELLAGKCIKTEIDEQIVYDRLDLDESAIWSLLLASGYLKIRDTEVQEAIYGQWKQILILNDKLNTL